MIAPRTLALDEHERLRRVRMALHDDAIECCRAGWSVLEWEERALADAGVRAAYDDERQLGREVEAVWRMTWRRMR